MGNRKYYSDIRLLYFILCVTVLLFGCESWFATPINEILTNPRNFDGKVVKISGQVTEVFSLIVIKYFTLRDRTGEITVVTTRLLPKQGTKITVNGKVEDAFSIGDKQLIVLLENEKTP